jgi:hypothetical protein
VNDIRAEIAQEPDELGIVAQEQKIELVMAIEGKLDPATA